MSGQKMDWKLKVELPITIFLLILVTLLSRQKNNYSMMDFVDEMITGPSMKAYFSFFALSNYDFTALWLSLLTSLAWIFAGWRIVYHTGQGFVRKLIKCMGVYLIICSIFYIINMIVWTTGPTNFLFAIFFTMVAWLITPFLGLGILYGTAYDALGMIGFFGNHAAFACFWSTWLTLIGIFYIGAKKIST